MKVERFDTDGIDIGKRLRPLSQPRVNALAASIQEIGLRTPLTVIARPEGFDTKVILVTGHHRLAALRQLGEDRVDCFVIVDDEIDAKLWEIDENLMRASLSPAEEAEHLKLRKELWEAKRLQSESGKTLPTLTGRGNKAFATETAGATGETKRSINAKIARAEAICADAMDLVKGTKLDTGVYLDKIKSLPPNDQVHAVRRDLAIERRRDRAKPSKTISSGKIESKSQPTSPTNPFVQFLALADELEALGVGAIISASGRQRAVLGQRASGLADMMSDIMEGLDNA